MKAAPIVIAGAGPAGMAAAIAARRNGAEVAVFDDNHAPGGQIWRGGGPADLFQAFAQCGAAFLPGARIVGADALHQQLRVEVNGGVRRVSYSKLILATGARELFLPFPGWTLPNVFGVGGLQALAKSGLDVRGKRVVVAGSGPLLLAVAAYLQEHGARVPVIAEQASWARLRGFSLALLRHPAKLRQALQIKRSLPGTRYWPHSWVVRALGEGRLSEVTILHEGQPVRERCDYLAIAYGFVPNTELAQLLGCRLKNGFVAVDEHQQTSAANVYCAGEPTGLGGVDESLLEGKIAGAQASGGRAAASRAQTAHFSRALAEAFALRPELRSVADDGTIVCRCEDVTLGRMRQARSWTEGKLHFRCGMGPCQGRICGPAAQYLLGWTPESVRPPVFPTSIQNLMTTEETMHS